MYIQNISRYYAVYLWFFLIMLHVSNNRITTDWKVILLLTSNAHLNYQSLKVRYRTKLTSQECINVHKG